ncbi:hypothetical protein [Nonomuraea turkmeniaca]|uniref:hypothetical protein n=1 Tax=Nonomuraea turkmeniaca TaxID=103838 RepID=UPI001B867157|nr:hypothetical protein [Nonomuraea turkmeniaca]
MTRLRTTADVIDHFNRAFVDHVPDALTDLIGDDCVMEAIQPALKAPVTKVARPA